jgi:hypothetical protein
MKYTANFGNYRFKVKVSLTERNYKILLKEIHFTNNAREFKCSTNANSNAEI